jgi:diketogulonate reductase-like aldo/keto reductase
MDTQQGDRRQFLKASAAIAALGLAPRLLKADEMPIIKTIPKSGEALPVIGMGTSRTFDTHDDDEITGQLQQVIQSFFEQGGGMIDSSPMYGAAQQVLGRILPAISADKYLFAATKVWIEGRDNGIEQMEASRRAWGIDRFDLMQIHNLVDWRTHLKTLEGMKAEGKIRYIGITTSHGRFHDQLEQILARHDFDFLQLSYNIANDEVEKRLLPLAQDRGIAVIVNRPFQRGELFRKVRGVQLPAWVNEFGCDSWGQYFLKYAVSHPAVTCAIPATSKVKHMRDNMGAGRGSLPTQKQRRLMRDYLLSL